MNVSQGGTCAMLGGHLAWPSSYSGKQIRLDGVLWKSLDQTRVRFLNKLRRWAVHLRSGFFTDPP